MKVQVSSLEYNLSEFASVAQQHYCLSVLQNHQILFGKGNPDRNHLKFFHS